MILLCDLNDAEEIILLESCKFGFFFQAIEQIDGYNMSPDSLRPVELVFEVPTRPGKLESTLIP